MSFKKLLYTLLGLCLLMVSAMAQQNAPASLTGRITDLNGEPLYQASITIVGTYLGTAANMDGEYVINNIKPNDYQVKVQFIGFETKIYNGISFEPGENKTLDIQLKEQSES